MGLTLRNFVSAGVFTLAAFLLTTTVQAAADCDSQPSIHCGSTPSATLAEGRLWTAFVQDQHVYVSSSDDFGKQFSEAVRVNPVPEDAEHNGENRPKIIVNGDEIYVTWTLKTSPRFTGEIRFSRSLDAGRTFSEPRTVNDDGLFTGHRFESLFLTESGHLYLTWIDKRDLEAAIEAEQPYSGAAIYYAVSDDGGSPSPRMDRRILPFSGDKSSASPPVTMPLPCLPRTARCSRCIEPVMTTGKSMPVPTTVPA